MLTAKELRQGALSDRIRDAMAAAVADYCSGSRDGHDIGLIEIRCRDGVIAVYYSRDHRWTQGRHGFDIEYYSDSGSCQNLTRAVMGDRSRWQEIMTERAG